MSVSSVCVSVCLFALTLCGIPSAVFLALRRLLTCLGNGIGFVEWRKPGKYGGQVNKIDSSSSIADIQFSPFQPGLLGVVSSNGVPSLSDRGNCR